MSNKTILGSITIFVLLVLIGAVPAGAQSIFLEPNTGPGIHLEILKPVLKPYQLSGTSFTAFLTGRARLGRTVFFRADLPLTRYEVEGAWYPEWEPRSTTSIGNIYLGLDVGPDRQGPQGEFGVRLPTAESDYLSGVVGGLSDPVERMEAFAPDVTSIFLGGSYRVAGKNGFRMRFRLVPVFQIDSGGYGSRELDVAVIHSALLYIEGERVCVGAGLKFGSFRPGFQIRFSLDEEMKSVSPDPVFSVGMSLLFPGADGGEEG